MVLVIVLVLFLKVYDYFKLLVFKRLFFFFYSNLLLIFLSFLKLEEEVIGK